VKIFRLMLLILAVAMLLSGCSYPFYREASELLHGAASLLESAGNAVDKAGEDKKGSDGAALSQSYWELAGGSYELNIASLKKTSFTDHEMKLVIDESLSGLTIETDEETAQSLFVSIDEEKKKIDITTSLGFSFSGDNLVITVGAPVHELSIGGSYTVKANIPSVKEFDCDIHGACSGEFAFGALDEFEMNASGASAVVLSGSCREADIDVSGAGALSAYDFVCERMDLSVSGVASCEVNVSEQLEVDLSGTGSVTYDGEPQVEENISGLGSVKKR